MIRRSWGGMALAAFALLAAVPVSAQEPLRRLGELELSLYGLSAGVEPLEPVVPRQVASGVRIFVRAGGRLLSSAQLEQQLGGPFEVQAELSGPGLPGTLSLPQSGPLGGVAPDPLVLLFPGLPQAGEYQLANIRIVRAGAAVLDTTPHLVKIRVIEQVLVSSVSTRPLTLAEIRERGIVLDSGSYLGFEFAVALEYGSTPIQISFPVVFDREGVPLPLPLDLPPDIERQLAHMPLMVPALLRPRLVDDPDNASSPEFELPDGGDAPVRIPSLLVIPGNVGYLKQHFSAQLLVANAAPDGSGLVVRNLNATIRLPPGADGQPETPDDPVSLPDTDGGPQSRSQAVQGENGEPHLWPGQQGRAGFTLRGEREGFHALQFDLAADLEGLPIGPVPIGALARGGVLVRNAYFDMTFAVPTVVRADEEFSVFVTATNVGQGTGREVQVTLDASRLSGAVLLGAGTQTIEELPPGDSFTLEYRLQSLVTGEVASSYLRFDTNGGTDVTGRLNFTLAVGERGVGLSSDTLLLPRAVQALPATVVRAAMRVLGQAWSVAQAPVLPPGVERASSSVVRLKALLLAEAGLRAQLGQPLESALRDALLDLHGAPTDTGFDQVLRQTRAGRDLDAAFAAALAPAVQQAPGALAYEEAAAEIASSGGPFLSFAVGGVSGALPADVLLVDGAGRVSDGGGSREVGSAALLRFGPAPEESALGWVASLAEAPYSVQINGREPGQLDVSLTVPGPDGEAQRALVSNLAVAPGSHARLRYDPSRAGAVDLERDADGDGVYETSTPLSFSTLSSNGPQLLAATTIGPETFETASPSGVYAALVFDRVVSADDAALTDNYTLDRNAVLAARRQLSGRLVFAALEQPEGPLVPVRIAVQGLRDERGRGGASREVELGSRLLLPGAIVSGRVLQADGTPVADAVVTYRNAVRADCYDLGWPPGVASQLTDAMGRYEFRYVVQSHCGVPFRMETRDPTTGAVRGVKTYVRTNGQHLLLDLVLIGHGSVSGVVRQASGELAAGARVRVVSVTDSQIGALALTDSEGRYQVHGITVGAVAVTAVRGPNLGRAAGRLDVAGGATSVDVTLDGNVTITGQVRKLQGGVLTPVPGVDVVYRRENVVLGVSVTDGSGHYRLAGVPAGAFSLSAALNPRDQTSLNDNSVAGQTLRKDLVIVVNSSGQGSVRGVVRYPDGAPAGGSWVSDNIEAVFADDYGSYELSGVLSGVQSTITAFSPDGLRRGSVSVTVPGPGQVVEGADIDLSGLGSAVFLVLDSQGQPLPDVRVGVAGNCQHPCGCRFVSSDAQGLARVYRVPFGNLGVKAVSQGNGPSDFVAGSVVVNSETTSASGVLRFPGYGTVTGSVSEASGQPAPGALVRLESQRFQAGEGFCGLVPVEAPPVPAAPNGEFRFEQVHVGPVKVTASSSFFPTPVSKHGTLTPAGATADFDLQLVDSMGGVLSGTVFLPQDGGLAAGIEVTASGGGLPDVTVHTLADGHFEFAPILPAGNYQLTARDSRPDGTGGLVRARVFLQPGQPASHDLRLKTRGPVRVTIVDGNDAIVTTGVHVRLSETEFPSRTYEGDFSGAPLVFNLVFEGPIALQASDALGRGGRASASVPPDGQPIDVKVRLTTTGTVSGRFLMPDQATPIPNATVKVFAGGRAIAQQTSASTGDVGSYSFDYVPAGELRLEAEDPFSGRTGVAAGTLTSEGQQLALNVVAQAVGRVEGDVTLNQGPAPSAEVTLRSGSYSVRVTADGAGHYGVDGVPAGLVQAGASLSGGLLKGYASNTLSNEGQTLALPVALQGAGRVEGQLLSADGANPGAVSLVTLISFPDSQTTTTDDEGHFSFELVREGQALVIADALGSVDCARAEGVSVTAGQTTQLQLQLRGVGALQGTIADSGGPVSGSLWVTAIGYGCSASTRWYNVGSNGQFSLPGTVAGPVSASFRTTTPAGAWLYGSGSDVVLPGQTTTLDLQVESSGTLQGRVLHQDGQPAFGANVAIKASGNRTLDVLTGVGGLFLAEGVPVGPATLLVTDPLTSGVGLAAGISVPDEAVLDVGDIQLTETPFAVASAMPANGALNVPQNAVVQIEFSAPLVHVGGISVATEPGGQLAIGTALSPDGRTVTITPLAAGGWPHSVQILVQARDYVGDVYGRRLGTTWQSRFRTVDLSPPKVLSVLPLANAIQVAPSATVSVVFDEALSTAGDLQSVVLLNGPAGLVAGSVEVSAPNALAFTPASPLPIDASYTVTVNGASDLLGHVQTTPFSSGFKTLDTVPPTLQLNSPAAALVDVRRPVVNVLVSDAISGPDQGQASIVLDGVPVPVLRGTNFFRHTPTADLAEGSHSLVATTHDRAHNAGTLAFSFVIDSVPPAAALLVSPTQDQVLSGDVTLSASAADAGSGVDSVEYLLDGNIVAFSKAAPSYAHTWSAAYTPEGECLLSARAVDVAGNRGPAGPVVRVIVNDLPLSVGITSPAAGARFAHSVTVTAAPSEDVQRVEFQVGAGAPVIDTQAPYEAQLDLDGQPEGDATLTVTAVGLAPENGTATRTIVVDRTPPAAPDVTRLHAESDGQSTLVLGLPGAVEPSSYVEARNVATEAKGERPAALADGSLALRVPGQVGQTLAVTATDAAGNQSAPAALAIVAVPSAPDDIPVEGLSLWARAELGVTLAGGAVAQWSDQSAQGNHLLQSSSVERPGLATDVASGGPVLRFDGVDDVLLLTSRLDHGIKTAFWVLRQNGAASTRYVMGDVTGGSSDFSAGTTSLWASTASPALLEGQTWLNGVPVDGKNTARPQVLSALSIVPTAGLSADRLFRSYSAYTGWQGDIAELIVYDRTLTAVERKLVEDHLARKHALFTPQVVTPTVTPPGALFAESATVTLGSPTPAASVRYTLDGSEPTELSDEYTGPLTLTESATLKAKAFRPGHVPSATATAAFVREGTFTPASLPGLGLWVRADSGVQADEAGRVGSWTDGSGSGNHLVQATLGQQPVLVPGALNGLPVLRFDGSDDFLQLTTPLAGTLRTAFWVLKPAAVSSTTRWLMGYDGNPYTDFTPGGTYLWSSNTSASLLAGQTWLNGVPVDGKTTVWPTTTSVLSVVPTAGLSAGRLFYQPGWYSSPWFGDLAELAIYDRALTASERKAVEDYLVLKYAPYVGSAGLPEFSPNGGTFSDSVTVGLSTPTPGAQMRYTTDGSEPDAASTLYAAPLALTASTTIKARAYRDGMNPSPVAAVTFVKAGDFSPAALAGLALWVRADAGIQADAARRVSVWTDGSPAANHLQQPTPGLRPVLVPGAQAGLPVVRFDGSDDFLAFTTPLSGRIRTAFWVLKQTGTASTRWLMGDSSGSGYADFAPAATNLWGSNASANLRSGQTWLNGVLVDGQATPRPQSMSVLSIVPTAGLSADRLFRHTLSGSLPWLGDLAELIVYDQALTASERKSVEDYLVLKHGLYAGTVAAPQVSPDGGTFNGTLTVSLSTATPGAEIRYTLDGSQPDGTSAPYVAPLEIASSTTVKALALRSNMNPSAVSVATFVEASEFSPATWAGLRLWVRSDEGVTADAQGRVSAWSDRSTSANHLVQPTAGAQPLLVPNAANGLPVLRFDGADDFLQLSTRLNDNIRTAFWVLKQQGSSSTGRWLMGDASSSSGYYDFFPGTTALWSSTSDAGIKNGQTWLNGEPINGLATPRPETLSVLSVVTTAGVSADRLFRHPVWPAPWIGDIAELIVYDQPLTQPQRKAVEDYLRARYQPLAAAAPPQLTPNGGSFSSSAEVRLDCTTPGVEMRYTLDGQEPTAESLLYTGPLTLSATTTVRAKAFHAVLSPSPTVTVTFLRDEDATPAALEGLLLWLRADAGLALEGSERVYRWEDQSPWSRHGLMSSGLALPAVAPTRFNGLPALLFDGSDDVLQLASRMGSSMGSMFWVLRDASAPGGSASRSMFGDSSTNHFIPGTTTIWSTNTVAWIRNGQTRLDGAPIDGVTSPRPSQLAVLSLVTNGAPIGGRASADRLGNRGYDSGGPWFGELAEVIVYDHYLTSAEVREVEEYLAARYGLTLAP